MTNQTNTPSTTARPIGLDALEREQDDSRHHLFDQNDATVYTGSVAHFARQRGTDLLSRTEPFNDWRLARLGADLWSYAKALHGSPGPNASMECESGRDYTGINFASQDYLGLTAHTDIRSAAIEAITKYGPHSSGSPVLAGKTLLSKSLELELADALKMSHVAIYPTGWAAGFGAVTGLVRPYDHVVMDKLAHACLRSGAYAATRNVVTFEHLDLDAFEQSVAKIRDSDSQNGILAITEGLFSMDADTPDIRAMQEICRRHGATLLVDVAHDFGSLGPDGTGSLGLQRMLGEVDLVVGSFSKTFATNGGFVGCNSAAVHQYLHYYGSPLIFSNALSPVQAATASAALRIVRSPEGERLRWRLAANATRLRDGLKDAGLHCFGNPSAIVPVLVGSERVSRIATTLLAQRGVLVNLVEYPAVAVGSTRFRLQVMATHSEADIDCAAKVIGETVAEVEERAESRRGSSD